MMISFHDSSNFLKENDNDRILKRVRNGPKRIELITMISVFDGL